MYPTPSEIIDALGGPTAVAKLAKRKPPSVCEWRDKDAIPALALIKLAPYIEKKLGIPKHESCPDVFKAPRAKKS